jgi:anaphase-promoting complex subunit 6
MKSRYVYKSNSRKTSLSIAGKSDPARRFLGKSTTLDKLFSPAWLAYGHSFAAENEHDQAMAAYFKASQLMKG